MISSLLFALQIPCFLPLYGSNRFFRRLSSVVNITHGMVVVLMEIFLLWALWFKCFFVMDANVFLLFKQRLKSIHWFNNFFIVVCALWFQ